MVVPVAVTAPTRKVFRGLETKRVRLHAAAEAKKTGRRSEMASTARLSVGDFGLEDLYVLGTGTLGTFAHGELHVLAFSKLVKARVLHC